MTNDAGRAKARAIGSGIEVPEENRTVEALLTDSSGGPPDDTVNAIAGSGADAAINKNFAELTTKVNAMLLDLHDRGVMDPS